MLFEHIKYSPPERYRNNFVEQTLFIVRLEPVLLTHLCSSNLTIPLSDNNLTYRILVRTILSGNGKQLEIHFCDSIWIHRLPSLAFIQIVEK